jgi:hypothetical protein
LINLKGKKREEKREKREKKTLKDLLVQGTTQDYKEKPKQVFNHAV